MFKYSNKSASELLGRSPELYFSMDQAENPYAHWSLADFDSALSSPVTELFELSSEDKLVAFIFYRVAASEVEILNLVAHPRGRGWGKKILEAFLTELRIRRRDAREVHLEFKASNVRARRLYEAVGFARLGIRQSYYQDGEDAVVMSLDLSRDGTQRSWY